MQNYSFIHVLVGHSSCRIPWIGLHFAIFSIYHCSNRDKLKIINKKLHWLFACWIMYWLSGDSCPICICTRCSMSTVTEIVPWKKVCAHISHHGAALLWKSVNEKQKLWNICHRQHGKSLHLGYTQIACRYKNGTYFCMNFDCFRRIFDPILDRQAQL